MLSLSVLILSFYPLYYYRYGMLSNNIFLPRFYFLFTAVPTVYIPYILILKSGIYKIRLFINRWATCLSPGGSYRA